ncbi:hypothetical protein Dda_3685 [Drechslerella dactyloides]|uniref:Uncharacterized protein n=1 Tax=Drechslerella dactyloides TaxID=74499 RepID=A0AAD6IYE5_DREDA|nr:hypothetical protein Dda_3685 [Drechslerella dactyloides]
MTSKRGNKRPQGSSQQAPTAKRRRAPEPSEPSTAPVAKRARTGTESANAESSGGPADTSLKVGMVTRSMGRRVPAATQDPKDPNQPTTAPAGPAANNHKGRPLCPETQRSRAAIDNTPAATYDLVLDNKPRRRRPRQGQPHQVGLYENYRNRRGTALCGYRLKPVNPDPSVPSWRGVAPAGFIVRQTAVREVVPAGGSNERGEPEPSVAIVSGQSRPTGTRGVRKTATAGGKTRGSRSSGGVTTSSSAAVQHSDNIPGSLTVPDGTDAPSRLKKRKRADFGEEDDGGHVRPSAKRGRRREQLQHEKQQQQMSTGTTDAISGTSIHLDASESTITSQALKTQMQASPSRSVPSGRIAAGRGKRTRAREAAPAVPVQASGGVVTDRPAPAVEPLRRSQRLLAKSRGET